MNYKFLKFLVFIFLIKLTTLYPVTNLIFSVSNNQIQNEKIKCLTLIVDQNNNIENVIKFAQTLKYDLEFTDQLDISLKKTNKMPTENVEKSLFEKNKISLCLYILGNSKNTTIELKDLSNSQSIYKKDIKLEKNNLIKSAHRISSDLLPKLTGEIPISQYFIAYSEMITNNQKNICIADYSCNFKNTIISKPQCVNIAPSWHTKLPIIYYSQFTKDKINLNSFNFRNKTNKIICSYDGINMQPSFSKDGSKAALCMSGGKNTEIYLYDTNLNKQLKKNVFKKLTNNGSNNVSPCLLENNDLIYCSDFQTGQPQIYHLNRNKTKTKRLTNGKGSCAAPSYCEKTKNLIYSKNVKGTFQLFSLNLENMKNLVETQLTFNFGNKHEPDISECGRFILFSYDFKYKKDAQTQQIAALNINSEQIRVLTQTRAPKSFPKWSKTPIIT